MIFVTVGMNEFPFDRLLRAIDSLALEETLIVQQGASTASPIGATCFESLTFQRLVAYIDAARAVVAHAGVGSVMVSLSRGRRPILMPRRQIFGEHVDDHQVTFAHRLGEAGLATIAEDVAQLAAAIATENIEPSIPIHSPGPLVAELQDYFHLLLGDGCPPLGRAIRDDGLRHRVK